MGHGLFTGRCGPIPVYQTRYFWILGVFLTGSFNIYYDVFDQGHTYAINDLLCTKTMNTKHRHLKNSVLEYPMSDLFIVNYLLKEASFLSCFKLILSRKSSCSRTNAPPCLRILMIGKPFCSVQTSIILFTSIFSFAWRHQKRKFSVPYMTSSAPQISVNGKHQLWEYY